MAKVSDIEFDLNGTPYKVQVKCSSQGVFHANLPKQVADVLDIQTEIRNMTLGGLKKEFMGVIDRYKKSNTNQELLIAIRYLSSGRFSEYKDGSVFFSDTGKYHLSLSFENTSICAIAFHFELIIKETVDTVENFYHAKKGSEFPSWDKEENENPDKYYKGSKFYDRHKSWKLIPYSDQSHESLQNAQEKIRAASELLFKFIEQDEKKIEQALTKNKLLN